MKEYARKSFLMGSAFELCVVERDRERADELLQMGINEIMRIEALLSEFKKDSETSRINAFAAQELQRVDAECYSLLQRSLSISKLTGGNFDITVSPLKKLFSFKNDGFQLPNRKSINAALNHVGFEKVRLNDETRAVRFSSQNLRISFAAIGKGYASDQVKKLWLREGVEAGFINASGDLNAFGTKSDGSDWRIGIANPDEQSQMLMFIPARNISIATSGDYEQFFMHKGKRYSHNINPRTGMPLTGIKSVSVVSPSAELSDALATAVYVMGSREGINFVNQLPQTHALIIDDSNKVHMSKDMNYEKISA